VLDKSRFAIKDESRYRKVTIVIIMMGVMMSAVDTTAVVLGLPVIMEDLNTDIIGVIWVLMGYLFVITILGTQVGRIGDMLGRVKMYNLGFAVFTLGSLFCGLASNGPELIGFRLVQGVGGALISSNSGAIIADTFSFRERGKAFGYTGLGFSVGAVLGILVGGIFVTFLNWRYIFFINIPIGIAATAAGYLLLQERSPRIKAKLDLVGMTLLGVGLFLILLATTNIAGEGYTSASGLQVVVGAVLIVAFVLWEKRYPAPVLDLTLMRSRIFSASVFASFFQALASYAVIFLVIMYLQGPRGLSPFDASLLLIPGYVLGGFVAPFAGRLSDRMGARVIATLGLCLQAGAIFVYSTLALDTSLVVVVLGSVLSGAGTACFFPANTSAVMASAPPKAYGVSAGLLRTLSNLGMVSSFALAILLASLSIPRDLAFQIFLGVGGIQEALAAAYIDGMHAALLGSLSLIVVAIVLSAIRGKEARTQKSHPGPS